MKWEIIFWLAFALGQALFILRRAGLAVRSPMNGLRSRWQYVKLNWDILTIRFALEFIFIFTPYRHVPIAQLMAKLPWQLPFNLPQNSVVVCLLLGYFSDSLMDTAAMQEKLFGLTVPGWVKETIPQFPEVQELAQKLTEQQKR